MADGSLPTVFGTRRPSEASRSEPVGLGAYSHRNLLDRIGVSNYEWQHTPARVASTAGGIQLTPPDFAKFGELHRNRG